MRKEMKKNRLLTGLFAGLYIIYALCLFWFHPFVASAKEPVPGGTGNTVKVSASDYAVKERDEKNVYEITMVAKDEYEIVGCILSSSNNYGITNYDISFYQYNLSSGKCSQINSSGLSDYTGYYAYYKKDNLQSTSAYSMSNIKNYFYYADGLWENLIYCDVSGCKIFQDRDALDAYVKTGSLDGMIKEPELDKQWYLKEVKCNVTADDSPSSEAGEDATYITFHWLTDNLQEGDLVEIRTHNVLKKIGGDQISGFHDYITKNNRVSAYDNFFKDQDGNERASYSFSQYEATKAWFASLENKPLMFKSYETDIYYLRPYREGKYGGWVKVTMGRATPTSSPFIESVEVGDLDENNNWIIDKDLTEENGGIYGSDQNGNLFYPDSDNPFEGTNLAGIFKYFFNFMKSIPSFLGDLPALVSSICSFLPSWVIGFIALGVLVAIILRVVGR